MPKGTENHGASTQKYRELLNYFYQKLFGLVECKNKSVETLWLLSCRLQYTSITWICFAKKKKITDTELIGNALLSTSPVLLSSYIKKFNLHLFIVLLFELRNLDLPLFHNSKHSLFKICGYKGLEWPFLLYEKVYFVENLVSFYLMLNTRKNRVLCQSVLPFFSPKQSNSQMTVSPQFFLPS